jgi:hypothetical protein
MRSLLAVLAVLAMGCGNNKPASCSGKVTSASATTSLLNATGTFSGGQPIVEILVDNQVQAFPANTAGPTSAGFALGGIPAGTYQVNWFLSCDDGSGEIGIDGPATITITQPSGSSTGH